VTLTFNQHRTGCVTACFRKTQYIQNDPAIAEYRDYSYPKCREDDMRFIKSFDPSIVLPIAQSQGWLPTPPPEPNDGFWHLKHPTEIPTYEDVAAIKSDDEHRDQVTRIPVKWRPTSTSIHVIVLVLTVFYMAFMAVMAKEAWTAMGFCMHFYTKEIPRWARGAFFSFVFVFSTHSDGVHRVFTQGKAPLEKLERQL
jgi:hypothetical protein